jgi:hypothetical protein
MIEFSKKTMSEEKLREITKDYPGIRYKHDKNGEFVAYANAWTIIVDLFKKIRK